MGVSAVYVWTVPLQTASLTSSAPVAVIKTLGSGQAFQWQRLPYPRSCRAARSIDQRAFVRAPLPRLRARASIRPPTIAAVRVSRIELNGIVLLDAPTRCIEAAPHERLVRLACSEAAERSNAGADGRGGGPTAVAQAVLERKKRELLRLAHIAAHRTNYTEGGSTSSSGTTAANRNGLHLV